jgi:hypothetical protein
MKNIEIIHLLWEEYEWNEDIIYDNFNSKKDHGIYQIYGDHPVYGENVLLYIGKARYQTYSVRLNQHNDFNESHISKFRKLYLSYFCNSEDVNDNNWGEYIDLAEKLLINAHFPAYNSQEIKGPINNDLINKDVLILNWNERGKLLPEISSLRYSYYYWDKKNLDHDKILKEK